MLFLSLLSFGLTTCRLYNFYLVVILVADYNRRLRLLATFRPCYPFKGSSSSQACVRVAGQQLDSRSQGRRLQIWLSCTSD